MTVHDMTHSESIDIAASPAEVYNLVRQLNRMGEWSPENTGGSWIKGDGSSVGDQLEGVNRIGDREWSVVATVNIADEASAYGFYTGPADAPYVQWTYQIAANGDGTTLTEVWDVIELPPTLAEAPPKALAGRKAQVQEAMAATVTAMKATLES